MPNTYKAPERSGALPSIEMFAVQPQPLLSLLHSKLPCALPERMVAATANRTDQKYARSLAPRRPLTSVQQKTVVAHNLSQSSRF